MKKILIIRSELSQGRAVPAKHTVNILKIRTPEKFAVIILKF